MVNVVAQVFEGAGGVRLMADVAGDPAWPSVVLSPGGGQTRMSWGGALKALVKAGFHVVSLDLRGHGESDWAPGAAYDVGEFAADLRAVARQLPSPPAFVGASMGGLASLVAMGEVDEKVGRALVLVDVAPRLDPKGAARISGFMREAPEGFDSVEAAADAVARFLPHRPRPSNVDGLRRNLRLRDGRYYWHWDPDFMRRRLELDLLHERYIAAARGITEPTALVRGGKSEVVSEEAAEELLALIPQAVRLEIPAAHHMVAGDRNDAFNHAVVGFLKQLEVEYR